MPMRPVSEWVLRKKRRAPGKDLTAYLSRSNGESIGLRPNGSLLIRDDKGLCIFEMGDVKELLPQLLSDIAESISNKDTAKQSKASF